MKMCRVQEYRMPFVYLNVRDYLGVDIDGMIGVPLDELVQEIANDVVKEMNDGYRQNKA